MANQPVKFRKGVSTSLPKTPTNETIGAFLLETDTGNLYVDESATNRIQIKDSTKANKEHTHTIADLPFTLKNNTTAGTLDWKDKTTDSSLVPTINTIAYWNGAFATGLSNIEYVKVGQLGTAATLSKSNVINNASIKDNVITFTKANSTTNTTTVTLPILKGATTSVDGSLGFVPAPTKSDVSKFLKGDGTWTAITIPTIPTSLKNPNAITIKLNGGNTEGTNLFTYDGSVAKSIDITPSSISASTSTHTHGNITNDGKVGTAANKVLTTSTGGAIVASDEGTAFNKNFETSTSNIKANGTVSVGTSTNVARADHVHPIDTSRASADALTEHTDSKVVHITADERNNWNAKQDKLVADTDYLTPTSISNKYLKKNPDGTNNLIGTDDKINSTYLPTYTASSVGLGNVTNDKQVKGLSTKPTENHIVTWGADGFTVKDSGYTIATSVPANAKFTDTTSTLVVGSKSTSSTNESVTTNNIYLNLFNNTTLANSHNIVGTGATTVSSDANGKITINTPSVTHEAGTTTDLGLTKLYVDTGDNVDGTITQQRLTKLFNGVEESVNNISDSYRDLKDYVDNKFSGEDTGDATDTPIAFATKDYVDEQYKTITSKLDSNYTELTSKDEEILGMINDINGSLNISDYVRTSEKDNLEEDKLLELGYVDNPYIQKINANSIAFYQGDTVMASVHDNKIEANNINVKNTITLGDEDSGIFEILVDSANGFIIR